MKLISHCIMSALLASSLAVYAETAGTIPQWAKGQADLMMTGGGPPTVIGQIGEDGSVSLTLPDSPSPNPRQTMQYVFGCGGAESVSLSHPDTAYEITPVGLMVGVMAERKRLGYVTAGSSAEKARALMDYENPAMLGSQYQWMWVPEQATITGRCTSTWMESNDDPQVEVTTHYDIALDAGWNLLEWEIQELFETSTGTVRAKTTTIRNLADMPDDISWYFEADE